MSSAAVRTAFRNLAADASWPAPFVESVSFATEPSSLPDLWTTLAFSTFENGPIGIGPVPRDQRERGVVEAFALGRTGLGDAAVVTTAEQMRDALYAWGGFPSTFHLTQVGAPSDPDQAGDGSWYAASVRAEYFYDYVQS